MEKKITRIHWFTKVGLTLYYRIYDIIVFPSLGLVLLLLPVLGGYSFLFMLSILFIPVLYTGSLLKLRSSSIEFKNKNLHIETERKRGNRKLTLEYISIAKIELIALYQVGDIVRFGLIFFDNFDRKICTIGFLDDYDKANYKTGSIDQAIEVINTILPKNRNIRIVDKKQFLGIMPK